MKWLSLDEMTHSLILTVNTLPPWCHFYSSRFKCVKWLWKVANSQAEHLKSWLTSQLKYVCYRDVIWINYLKKNCMKDLLEDAKQGNAFSHWEATCFEFVLHRVSHRLDYGGSIFTGHIGWSGHHFDYLSLMISTRQVGQWRGLWVWVDLFS